MDEEAPATNVRELARELGVDAETVRAAIENLGFYMPWPDVAIPADLAGRVRQTLSPDVSLASATTSADPQSARLACMHGDIQRACGELWAGGHAAQAALEAVLCVMHKLRERTGASSDGVELIKGSLDGGISRQPLLDVKHLDRGPKSTEQGGISSLARGLWLAYRNPIVHRRSGALSSEEALEVLSLASLLLRRIDAAVVRDPGDQQ